MWGGIPEFKLTHYGAVPNVFDLTGMLFDSILTQVQRHIVRLFRLCVRRHTKYIAPLAFVALRPAI
jgi:hypothetical protein